jgi:DNA-binding MarR family transcriptional regulator
MGPFSRVTASDALEAIRRAISSAQPYFQDLWATCSDLERLILTELAYSLEEWSQVDSLIQDPNVELGNVHQALKQLKRRELIERRGSECCFQVPMMRQWIKDEKSLDAVRLASRSLSETVREHRPKESRGAGWVEIENFYISGAPIPPHQKRVFVGREDLFATIQENLSATHKPTLVLHGQRRTGKTSLLLQLPSRLSNNYVPVFVDLQEARALSGGLNYFLYTLTKAAVHQANKERNIALPRLEWKTFDSKGTDAFYDWLDLTHRQLQGRLLLFALDEFDKIELAIQEGQIEVAVLDVLRHLIQNPLYSSWLVLLFTGVRTLEEMGRNWHSYFISVRPIPVSYLTPEAARRLILLPTETHSIRYDHQAVEMILEATHAQPFLVQAVCFDLIQFLNSRNRRLARPSNQVTMSDAQEAIRRAVRSAKPYFQNLWATCNNLEQLLLVELAYSQGEWARVDNLVQDPSVEPRDIHQALKQLKRRELIERKGRECCFQVPMMQQWIKDEKSLDAVRLTSQSSYKAARQRD